jgi:GPI mannosyltransferase 1 subunit M
MNRFALFTNKRSLNICDFESSYVYSDAAQHIQNGNSPYNRTTYRYTPFLAYILSILPHREYGRLVFCIADTICGYIIILYRRQHRTTTNTGTGTGTTIDTTVNEDQQQEQQQQQQQALVYLTPELQDAMWWLYNPLAINICTRGSAESFIVLLPVLLTVWITTSIQQQSPSATKTTTLSSSLDTSQEHNDTTPRLLYSAAIMAGICHGIAIHAKLYPIIYTLSFMTQFVHDRNNNRAPTTSNGLQEKSILYQFYYLIRIWMLKLLRPAPILFGMTTVLTFGGVTYLAVYWYGPNAFYEGLIYHFSRVDHRHNYSMHWYWIYLIRDHIHTATLVDPTVVTSSSNFTPQLLTKIIGYILLLPQLTLLLYSSLGIAPYSLSLALFVQTFLFVAQNKVITAQYFTWYLCILPLCSDQFRLTRRVRYALLLLGISILVWLSTAYCLEMQGMSVHRIVWIASLFFFVANVNLLSALLSTTAELRHRHRETQHNSKMKSE